MTSFLTRLFVKARLQDAHGSSPSETNLKNITFCTGYWHIPQNKKRNLQHYLDYLPRTIEMVRNGKLLVFFEDPRVFSLCAKYAKKHGVSIVGKQMPSSELPYFNLGDALLTSCKAMDRMAALRQSKLDKGAIHYSRDYLEAGEEGYKNLMSVWMSKIPLVTRHAIPMNPFGTPKFAWIDFSVSRFSHKRNNWNFRELDLQKSKIYHYPNTMKYYAERLKLNASFLCGSKKEWATLDRLFEQYLLTHLKDAYAHDEETILNFVVNDRPNLFANCSRIRSDHPDQA
jgi:uncharacterized protein HtrL/YibB-like